MKIVFVGSGNVAAVLARLCSQRGHTILQFISRNLANAEALAVENNCRFSGLDSEPDAEADIIIVAISDDGLKNIQLSFNLGEKLLLHTAGSVSVNVLNGVSTNCGVLWPLQTLRREMRRLPEIPFIIDASSKTAMERLENFAQSLSPLVGKATDEERKKLHLSAVLVNNFTNHLYVLAEQFCASENLDFRMLAPLLKETALRAAEFSPSSLQTGPAFRNDQTTMDAHLEILQKYPALQSLYKALSESIMGVTGKK